MHILRVLPMLARRQREANTVWMFGCQIGELEAHLLTMNEMEGRRN